MKVVAVHNIVDPDGFYSAVDRALSKGLPEGFKLRVRSFASNRKKGVTSWEGPSTQEVKKLVDAMVAPYSRNEYFEVETLGLPE